MKKMGWHFPADKFTGSAGMKKVSGYQRGGKVQRHTDRMEHKPDVDAMAKGGKVHSDAKQDMAMLKAKVKPGCMMAKGGHVKKSAHKAPPRAAGPSPMAQAAMAANLEPPPGPPMGGPGMGGPPMMGGGPPMGMKKGGMAKAKKGC